MKIKTTLSVAFLALGLLTFTGCTTGTNNNVAKAESVAIPSVNAAMDLWKTRVESGLVTQKQVDQVKVAYEAYYHAQLVMKAALEKSISSKLPSDEAATAAAAKSATEAQAAIIAIIQQLLK